MPESTRPAWSHAVVRTLASFVLGGLAACGDASTPAPETGTAGGTVVVATPAEPDNLAPPITTSQLGHIIEDLVFERLADLGPALNTVGDAGFTPRLATRWRWAADSLSIAFTLDSAARWHDGRPVRADDVRFTFELTRDPRTASPLAALIGNIDSVSVRDERTAVVWFRRRTPEQFFEATYQLVIVPRHLLASVDRAQLAASDFARNPVGSGPLRFAGWKAGQALTLVADTTAGRRRAKLDRVVFTIAPDPQTAYTRFATGEADIFEAVRPDRVAEVAANASLRLQLLPSLDYQYVAFNFFRDGSTTPHPVLGDRVVRQALVLASNRPAIVRNIYDSLAVVALGPFTRALASADTSLRPAPVSPDSAEQLLDAAGWRRGADSMRVRDGVRLAFSILVPSTSAARLRAATLLQEQFRRIGVQVTLEQVDFPTFLSRLDARRFEALMGAWQSDPSPSGVRQTWGSTGAVAGGENAGRYRSAVFDAHVDSGLAAFDPALMKAHFAAAWRVINDDAPAIWLAESRRVLGLHARLQPVGMRPDAWWAQLDQWTIRPGARLARDGGEATATR
ncbi:MAG: peptide ABC transporter substrate-binding protein [Gemmatimonadaceae bacterium]|nr:peptide ABC transporter substrate-binding protein [Gemmatimonadaceae bacterium]